MSDCLSPHFSEPEPNHKRLTWFKAGKDSRRGTLARTCHCDVLLHELCTAGGQSFLRRTDRAADRGLWTFVLPVVPVRQRQLREELAACVGRGDR